MIVFITIPPLCNFSVIKKDKIYAYFIYSDFFRYKIYYGTPHDSQLISHTTKTISFVNMFKNPYDALYTKHLNVFLYSWSFYFYQKIKFTGKGYRITFRKRRKKITFFFGHSHITMILFRTVLLWQPHKYKFVIVKNSLKKLVWLNKLITKIKPMNMYTRRGIRNSRQIIFKRKGKKSTY
jgi:hypothetical protein